MSVKVDKDNPIASIRSIKQMSQRELAAHLGYAYSWVYKAEKRGDNVQLSTLRNVADAAGLELVVRVVPKEKSNDG